LLDGAGFCSFFLAPHLNNTGEYMITTITDLRNKIQGLKAGERLTYFRGHIIAERGFMKTDKTRDTMERYINDMADAVWGFYHSGKYELTQVRNGVSLYEYYITRRAEPDVRRPFKEY